MILGILILKDLFREHCLKLDLLQLSQSMFCKNGARLAVARGCHTWIRQMSDILTEHIVGKL